MKAFFQRLEAAHLNGLSVALGVTVTHALVGALFGETAGLAAVGGAVCASLPDVPNPPQRVLPRVLPAAAAAALVTLLVGLADGSLALTVALVAVVAFLSLMALAWGLRAGPLSFTPVLAMVFAMAWDRTAGATSPVGHAAWVCLGGCVYALWARLSANVLRHRLRQLALANALRATERRLRSRAQRIAGAVGGAEASIRASIADDVLLAEALQAARDQVFAARRSPRSRKQTDLVLGLIELRDLLLASRLDTELLGQDFPGRQWRAALAETLRQLADVLSALADSIAYGVPLPDVSVDAWREQLAARLTAVSAPPGDSRAHLVSALQSRLGHMLDDVAAMVARQGSTDDPESPWTPERLAPFVSPEGWPLAALKPHLTLQSSVMRHALRSALALSLAYALGAFLPWAAHPFWLMLSVAVVLRGNLEQTLSRRNERIIGTVLGCLLVLLLAHLHSVPLLSLCFIAAVGTAHAYVNRRYRVAATAATLMALLQPLMLAPGSNPAVVERLADTLIGAGLAWLFSFVLPSWERSATPRLAGQLRGALARHASNMLRWAPGAEEQLAQRLSRQQAYAALSALAATAQRTRVEPLSVRLPEAEVESALSHGYRLMALLGAVQHQVQRRGTRLDAARAETALPLARKACVDVLKGEPMTGADPAEIPDGDAGAWPEHLGQQDLTPWLLRRLRLCRIEAREFVGALELLQPAGKPE
ncbi:FUSC family protein [Roseateles saccharophilus]|uniref:Putative membrane protein YccC n=1 Tax=Roseateles saccharophilus TaxID=304 RepID=A0A4R3UJ03_ROSSA|nr:FUSC family protein [Roseateles saccharophilus]TCU88280.1 putative membrane protein YccC [Roseateles saccharophilus]